MWAAAKALMARDLRLLWRRRGDALQPALFALLVVVLFALALGGEAQALAKVAAAVLWLEQNLQIESWSRPAPCMAGEIRGRSPPESISARS